MSLIEKIQHGSELKSRRFSKGVHCFIINDDIRIQGLGLLSFCIRNGLAPSTFAPDFDTGYDTRTGIFLLFPYSSLEDLIVLIKGSKPPEEGVIANTDQLRQLITFLRQRMISARAPFGAGPDLGAPIDGRNLDALAYGVDVLQMVEVDFVLKHIEIPPRRVEWRRNR